MPKKYMVKNIPISRRIIMDYDFTDTPRFEAQQEMEKRLIMEEIENDQHNRE